MSRTLSLLAAAALATAALTACSTDAPRDTTGAVTASASADAFAIKVGDCTGKLSSGEISGANLVPCADSHYFEAFSSTQMTDAAYPGEDATTKQADKHCAEAFTEFVGISTSKSKYGVFYLYPNTQSWTKLGDREILCLAGSDTGGIKGSLKGVKM